MRLGAAAIGLAMFSHAVLANSATTTGNGDDGGLMTGLGAGDFRTYCAACHGVEGRGDGTVAEYLTISAANLTQLKKKNAGIFPRERIIEVIDGRADVKVHGPRDMPVWGDWFSKEAAGDGLNKEQREMVVNERINALVAYIETLQE
jgi:mono/diheme cytochrome c family protein